MDDTMHIGVLYLGRRGGLAHYSLELARALASRTRLTCYLSAFNTHLSEWERLPCTVRTFATYTDFRTLLCSLITRSGPRHVARAITQDKPHVLLDTGAGPWA